MAISHPETKHLDVAAIRRRFPIFDGDEAGAGSGGKRLVYLDSAASSQKPRSVMDAMTTYYETTHANVHRGVYGLAEEATRLYEDARARVANLIGAPSPNGVVFTKNVTEAINLVAHSWGRANLQPGDAVLLSELEHHANLVPWLMLAERQGIELRYLPMAEEDHSIDLTDLERLADGVKLISVTGVSNVTGAITPVKRLAEAARATGARLLVDGAQTVPHLETNVQELGCDFFGFTGHKMLGPTGIGVLWAHEGLLDSMPAFLGGGEMIRDVRLDGWTPNEVPWKFEAGTPPIAEAVGLAAAIDELQAIGLDNVRAHEVELTSYALDSLADRLGDDLTIYGPTDLSRRGALISFTLRDVHAHDVSQVLDDNRVCVRAGHHCAKPLMRRLGVSATARASLYLYNDREDVDALADALVTTRDFFAV